SATPHKTMVQPYKPVRIQSNDGTTTRTHWVGWIEKVEPTVNANGQRQCKITAAGPMLFFMAAETRIALQENQRTDQIIAELLKEVVIPPALNGAWYIGTGGMSEIGASTWLANTSLYSTLDAGKTTLALAGDTWVRQGGLADQRQDTFDVYRAIKDVTAAERGRFFFDRSGKAIFWNRHRLLDDNTIAATFDDAMTGLTYNYAGADDLKNEVSVVCHPRTISGTSDQVLWQMSHEQKVPKGATVTVEVKYKDASGQRCGARNVT